MSFPMDEDALESLPLKLVIIAIVATMSVLPAGQALDAFRNRDYMMRAQLQLESVVSAAQTLMIEGPGGVRTLRFDFVAQGRSAFESLTIGDERGGPNMSLVILRTTGGAVLIRAANDPQVWLMSVAGSALTVRSPSFELRLSVQQAGRSPYVLAELV